MLPRLRLRSADLDFGWYQSLVPPLNTVSDLFRESLSSDIHIPITSARQGSANSLVDWFIEIKRGSLFVLIKVKSGASVYIFLAPPGAICIDSHCVVHVISLRYTVLAWRRGYEH